MRSCIKEIKKKLKYFHGYKKDRSYHKLKIHRSQQTHRKRVTSYGSLRDHCIENQEREREEAIQLLTTDPKVYKELLMHHQRGTNGGCEPHPRWCLDWIWWFWTLRRLDEYFVNSPRVFRIFGNLQSKEAAQGEPEVGTTHQGAPGAPGVPCWVVPSSGLPPGATRAQHVTSVP